MKHNLKTSLIIPTVSGNASPVLKSYVYPVILVLTTNQKLSAVYVEIYTIMCASVLNLKPLTLIGYVLLVVPLFFLFTTWTTKILSKCMLYTTNFPLKTSLNEITHQLEMAALVHHQHDFI